MNDETLRGFEATIARHVRQCSVADVAHDAHHVERVVRNAGRIGEHERANMAVVLPAAWLHDIVAVRKDSPDRARASTRSSGYSYQTAARIFDASNSAEVELSDWSMNSLVMAFNARCVK